MKIIHVITRFIVGGAQENTFYNVLDLVRDYKDDVILITGPAEGPEGNLFRQAQNENLDVRVMPELKRSISPRNDWKSYRKLSRIFLEEKAQVVHTHSSKAGIIGRAAAWQAKVPSIIHTIHGLPFHPYEKWWKNTIYKTAERWAAKRCHRILCVADAMSEQALAVGIGKPDLYRTIYSGMEVDTFLNPSDSREKIRSDLGFSANDLVIGKFARLFEFKGHDDVIDAAKLIVNNYPQIKFLFVGGGIWEERLKLKIDQLGLKDRFVFTGLVPPDRIPSLIHACDIVCHASYREGLARVLPQSLISGKPVVSYDVDGAKEVVLPDETGYLVSPGNVKELSQALRAIIEDPEKRLRFGQNGRERFTEQFKHQTMTKLIREQYCEVLDENRQS